MSSTPSAPNSGQSGVTIRPLREQDLPAADHIMRLAFGTFLGLPDPSKFMGDADYARTRWLADPSAVFAAELAGELVGTNFATRWGSVGFFWPLTIHPDLCYTNPSIFDSCPESRIRDSEEWLTRRRLRVTIQLV